MTASFNKHSIPLLTNHITVSHKQSEFHATIDVPVHTMEEHMGSRGKSLLTSDPNGQHHARATLTLGKNPATDWIGWVGPTASEDYLEILRFEHQIM
jgi:hypothetical protein